MSFSFASDLLCSGDKPSSAGASRDRNGVPKFKSTPPPSLPISPPSLFSIPPGLNPAELLDSPVLLSSYNILPSPTTGALIGQGFNWKSNFPSTTNYNPHKLTERQAGNNFHSDFTFQTQSQIQSETVKQEQSQIYHQEQEQKPWNLQEQKKQSTGETNAQVTQRSSDDGYNWRKYGQKQVKASENPRSYYKCTFPGCPTKKKVEKSIEGQVTEIVYKGTHSHPKPVKARRSSSSSSASMAIAVAPEQGKMGDGQETSFGSGQMDPNSVGTPDNSSISLVDDEIGSQRSRSVGDEFDDTEQDYNGGDQREAKRWKGEGENECMSAASTGNRTVREPRVVVQTKSDIDILDDGYRWRKYGQKVVKGNPNPRSYYKCTFPGCSVRKHVERAAHDLSSVITTYEGKHNHDIPAARGSSHLAARALGPTPSPENGGQLAIRPSAVNYASNPSNGGLYNLPYNNTRVGNPSDLGNSPFFMEMIQNPSGGFDFSSLGNSMTNPYNVNQQQQQQPRQLQYNASTKEEPRDDVIFESLLY
ncbi:hypothetical protein V2J09_018205 [Rumex salicifolius]